MWFLCIGSSFFALPIVTQRRRGQKLSIPNIGRTILEPSLLRQDGVDIKKIPPCVLIALKLSPWKNCLLCKMIKHTSPFLASTTIPLIRFSRSLLRCFPGTHLLTSQGTLLNLWNPEAKERSEDCLRLVSVWTPTGSLLNVLKLVFGLTHSNLSVYLRFGMHLIVETFWKVPLARVRSIPLVEHI